MITLIADSGSTKTDWMLIASGGAVRRYVTDGINPVVGEPSEIRRTLEEQFAPQIGNTAPDNIYFYGAGCTPQKKNVVEKCLMSLYPEADIEVASDVLAAARALCGHKEGIACILGTGSNSCLFGGKDIIANASPLGYILGDEGSGAVLGRNLVSDILKQQLPADICNAFYEETHLTETEIINRVYRAPMPNRFLASLVPFIYNHHLDSQIAEFLVANFRRFLKRNVLRYHRPDLPVNFIGGVAHSFEEEIKVALHIEHLIPGRIEQSPLSGLLTYHTTSASEDIF